MKRHLMLLLLTAAGLQACTSTSNVEYVVFTTGTVLGVDIQPVAPDGQSARVGYVRSEFVSMPTQPAGDDGPGLYAMPVFARFEMDTGALMSDQTTVLEVRQLFATGLAAAGPGKARAFARIASALATGHVWPEETAELARTAHDLFDAAWARDKAAAKRAASEALADGGELTVDALMALSEERAAETGVSLEPPDREEFEDLTEDQIAGEVVRDLILLAAHTGDNDTLQRLIDALRPVAEAPAPGSGTAADAPADTEGG
jgi:hypothetical protein